MTSIEEGIRSPGHPKKLGYLGRRLIRGALGVYGRATSTMASERERGRCRARLERLIALKVAALEKYASQHHRRYANAEYVRNLARMHGVNVNREFAEVFQVYRVVA